MMQRVSIATSIVRGLLPRTGSGRVTTKPVGRVPVLAVARGGSTAASCCQLRAPRVAAALSGKRSDRFVCASAVVASATAVVASATAAAPAEAAAPKPLLLKDYRPSPYLVQRVDLKFELGARLVPSFTPPPHTTPAPSTPGRRPSSGCPPAPRPQARR